MVRLARAELFAPYEVAILHVIGRVTRRCFLFGFDPVSGKNFDHRKVWNEEQLKTHPCKPAELSHDYGCHCKWLELLYALGRKFG